MKLARHPRLSGLYRSLMRGVVLAGLAVVAGGAALADDDLNDKTIKKSALGSARIVVGEFYHIERDCSNAGFAQVKLTQQPKHGRVTVIQTKAFPSFDDDNPRARCNQRRVPSVHVRYQANKGFTGADSLVFDVYYSDGDRWRRTVNIAVD